jgi:hypothetical protein
MPGTKTSKKEKGWEVAKDGGPVVKCKRLEVELPPGLYALLEKDLEREWHIDMGDLVSSIIREHYDLLDDLASGRRKIIKLEAVK